MRERHEKIYSVPPGYKTTIWENDKDLPRISAWIMCVTTYLNPTVRETNFNSSNYLLSTLKTSTII